ncbi:MAG: hypothetical protein HY928_02100 [Elusimicrobia bacterium]|nr:hypothetical protein [Elusimicrobiota bacterium]
MKSMVLAGALVAAAGAGFTRDAVKAPQVQAAEPAAHEAAAADPLTKAILQAAVARGDGGLVSVIRLDPAMTGVDHEQFLTRGVPAASPEAPAPK